MKAALGCRHKPDVYVSSEDEEILLVAKKCGAQTHRRDPQLADDRATLDPVIHDAYRAIASQTGKRYDLIITVQPTSPLLESATLDAAIEKMAGDASIETILSARKEAHLSWREESGRFVPNYKERVNRQYLEPYYFETGAFVVCRTSVLEEKKTRFGKKVDLALVASRETIDIDTYEDWNLCEYLLKRKTILFVVAGYDEIGLGHAYRALLIANGILNHRLLFLVDKKSGLAFEKIKESNYEVHMQKSGTLIEDVLALKPDTVINDILDTEVAYIRGLKEKGLRVINFEDLGEGARQADLVINALYPEKEKLSNHYFGHDYFCARDEFVISEFKRVSPAVRRVMVTMGGTDPNNLTAKVLEAIYPFCREKQIDVDVVLGMGYQKKDTLAGFKEAQIYQNIKSMSDFMLQADVIFTSAGRTVYEVSCIGTPAIVLAQNEREMTHFYASPEHGFVHLGLGNQVSKESILSAFKKLLNDAEGRQKNSERMLAGDLRKGKNRVLSLIQETVG